MEPPPKDPMLPQAGESALSLEFGLVMAAVGLAVFFFLIWRLVRQSRRAPPDETDRSGEAAPPADERPE